MKLILALIVVLFSGSTAIAELGTIDNNAKTRTVVGSDGQIYVEFYTPHNRNGLLSVTVPLTAPLGKPHYKADVVLYLKDGVNLIYVGKRDGEWIEGGCFEMEVAVPY